MFWAVSSCWGGSRLCGTHHCDLQCPSYKWGAVSSPQMRTINSAISAELSQEQFLCDKRLAFNGQRNMSVYPLRGLCSALGKALLI